MGKKTLRLTAGQKPQPARPRLIIRRKGEPRQKTDPQTSSVHSSSAVAPVEATTITLGHNIDTHARITVNTEQLCSGTYVLGVQGVGKSSLLEQIACQLMEQDESVIVFDPHGQLIDNIIKRMPGRRLRDTFHLDLKDRKYPFALNVFACADPEDEEERDRTHNRVMQAFEKLWPETRSGVYFQKILPHVVTLLIEHPDLTLADVPKLLQDSVFREQYTRTLRNEGSQLFWEFDYDQLTPSQQRTQTQSLLNRVQELLAEPVIKRILCQPRSSIHLRKLIEQRKNLLVRLPINEEAYTRSAPLVGIVLMSLIYATTFSFADVSEPERPGFSLIVDEFQNFATEDYAKLFSQGRKFRVKQFLAHQYRGQLSDTTRDDNRDATLSAFTKVIFRVTEPDSRALGSLFLDIQQTQQPVNLAIDILDRLERHPSPVVKEFAARYVWLLQAGAKDKMGTEERYIPRLSPADEKKHIPANLDYDTWRYYMLNHYGGYITPDAQPARLKQELWQRVTHPQRGQDYELVPVFPERDFGAGKTLFSPEGAEKALEALNKLLYQVQKTGITCTGIKDPETELTPEQQQAYKRNENSLLYLEAWLAPMLRFDEWLFAWDKASLDERLTMMQDTIDGKRPDLFESYGQLVRWRQNLKRCIDALIREPITQGGSEVRPSDVAQSLQHLPLRQTYVRIGTEGHVMQTLPLPKGVDEDEEERRRSLLRRQTRETLCRRVSSVGAVRDETQLHEEPVPVNEPQEVPDEPVPAASPKIRRTRPLP
jgi:hypothetical protein